MMATLSRLSALHLSLITHFSVIVLIAALNINWSFFKKSQVIDLDVIVAAPSNLVLQPKNSTPEEVKPVEPPPAPRQVFGVSRKAITTNQAGPTTVEVKQGNTVAKENDNLKLNPDDADSLPIPADDYLVTEKPKLLYQEKIIPTQEAMAVNYGASAVFVILIDKDGHVRDAQLQTKLDFGMDIVATEAVKKYQFKPAKIGDETVAIKVRITVNIKGQY